MSSQIPPDYFRKEKLRGQLKEIKFRTEELDVFSNAWHAKALFYVRNLHKLITALYSEIDHMNSSIHEENKNMLEDRFKEL